MDRAANAHAVGASLLAAIEPVEDVGQIFFGNALSGVLDHDLGGEVRLAHPHRHLPAGGGVFQAVFHQVGQGLLGPVGVTEELKVRGNLLGESDAVEVG